jgi:hypothetical protein
MTNSVIEQGLVEWLRAAGVTAPIHAGTSADVLSTEALTVIVSVPEVQHVIGPLHKATVHLITSAPANVTVIEDYQAVNANLRATVDAWRTNELATQLQILGIQLGGVHLSDSNERTEDNRWMHTLALTVGLSG